MATMTKQKPRVLIFIVAYNASRTIENVIRRIPLSLTQHETEILIIDDSSRDNTFEVARAYEREKLPFPIVVLYNPKNQGYGGNQKLGFHYAVEKQFDIVALLHGDGQYAPEELPRLLEPLLNEPVGAVFGSRMMTRFGALKGGMPLYKYVGNRVLTTLQNWILDASLSEFHSGYRLYAVKTLASIPFDLNTNDFHFDTDIIIQLLKAGFTIRELPIPTFYGDEICHVNGLKYAAAVVRASLVALAQEYGILYERKYDCALPAGTVPGNEPKLGYTSPHTMAIERIEAGATVLGFGWSAAHVSGLLKEKGCRFLHFNRIPFIQNFTFDDLLAEHEGGMDAEPTGGSSYLLLLDVLEHMRCPEEFLESLRRSRRRAIDMTVIVSTGNIAFVVTRLMLMLGFFNYGVRGILDRTHMRLFTFLSLKRLFRQAGFEVEVTRGIPAPYPLALGDTRLARVLLALNRVLIRISKTLFSYQIFLVARPLPSIEWLLQSAAAAANERILAGHGGRETGALHIGGQ